LLTLATAFTACTEGSHQGPADAGGDPRADAVLGDGAAIDAGEGVEVGTDASSGDACMVVRTSTVHSGDLPCPVAAVLMAKCQPCHQRPPLNGAHFSLFSYEDLEQPFGLTGLLRWQRMAQVIEPDGQPHMPPNTPSLMAPQLTEAELATLRGYFAMCAPGLPEGTGCDRPPGE
jgi:hypothetical protein